MRLVDDAIRDVGYAARVLRRSPAFAVIAVLSLALGIGANTAILSVIDALMFRPLPVDRPDELVSFTRNIQNVGTTSSWPYPMYQTVRGLGVFASVTASSSVERNALTFDDAPSTQERAVVGLVSGSYFATLGVRAGSGRVLTEQDDREPDTGTVAVISDAFWRRHFGGAPGVPGRTFTLNGTTYTIVGIGPSGFSGENVGDPTDLWVPIGMQSEVMPERHNLLTNATSTWIAIIARLKTGTTAQAAQDATRAIFQPASASWRGAQRLDVIPAGRGFSRGKEFFAAPLTVLMGVVGLVLLIACANVVTLLMARAAARQKELAVRLAIGASRWCLVRQLLAETVLITLIAGTIGLAIAAVGTRAIVALQSSGRVQIALDVHPDVRMLAITGAFSLLTGVLFGIAPAFTGTRFSLTSALTGARRAGIAGGARFRAGQVLIVVQVAITLILVIGATLLVRTFRNIEMQDAGFDRAHVWLFWMDARQVQRQQQALEPLFAAAEDQIGSIPGVISAAVSSNGILSGFVGLRAVAVPGRVSAPDEDVNAQWDLVGPHFFNTLGMHIFSGRDFTPADRADSTPVAIVNETMARHFFGETSPIGRRFAFGRDLMQLLEVVGVVHDSKYFSARDEHVPMVYLPYRQDVPHLYRLCIVVRTANDDAALIAKLRDITRGLDPGVPLERVNSTGDQFDSTLSEDRLTAWLSGLFGALALVLACIGLYGVMAYTVARRTREIGIRMALGATPAAVMRVVVGETVVMAGIGIALGIPASAVATRGLHTLLFGVAPNDPLTITAASVALLALAALAGVVPARRAARVDPLRALRTE